MKQRFLKVAVFSGSVAVGVLVVVFGGEVVGGNAGTLQMLVTAFSVLSGILLAIIAVSGDPSLVIPGGHRIAHAHREQLKTVLQRYKCLFYCYLATITLAVTATALGQIHRYSVYAHWIERVTLGVGAFALCLSFGLPAAMARTQLLRLDGEVDRRKEMARDVDDWPENPPISS